MKVILYYFLICILRKDVLSLYKTDQLSVEKKFKNWQGFHFKTRPFWIWMSQKDDVDGRSKYNNRDGSFTQSYDLAKSQA